MKVKDMLKTQKSFTDSEVNIVVKPLGTERQYYNSGNILRNEVAEMEVKEWFICGARKNKCDFVIIVERDENYETSRKKTWEDLVNKQGY